MAQIVKLRRSSVSGQKPTNANLQLGELALNTADGKAFMAKSGSLGPSIEELIITNTINTGSVNISGSINLEGNQTITGSLIVTDGVGYINTGLISENSDLLLTSGSNIYVEDGGLISTSILHVSGGATVNGDLSIGDSVNDRIIIRALFSSSLIPDLDAGERYIGGSQKRWNTVYALSGSFTHITASSVNITGSFSGDGSNLTNVNAETLDGKDSTEFAITGSNTFIGNQTINGNLNVTGSLTASGLYYPTSDNGEESFLSTDGNGTLSFNYVKTLYETVINGESFQLQKGTPVYVSGSVGATSLVYAADASNPSKMPVIYIVADTIDPAAEGRGIALGLITGVNTTGYPAGTEVFVGSGGGWTALRPTGSAIIQSLGIVTKEGNGGQGVVLNPGPNNLPNLNLNNIWVGDSDSHPEQRTLDSLGFATSGSNTYIGNQTITGSLTITQDLTVLGSSSLVYVTSSQLAVSASFISVNVFEPAERFGGLKVYDSGSSNATASLAWDSLHNHWVYQNVDGSNYSGGMLIAGPRNTGSLGDEPTLTLYRVPVSQGGDHIGDSSIIDSGSNVIIEKDTIITGSLTVTGGIDGVIDFIKILNKPTLVSGSSQIEITGVTGYSTFSSSLSSSIGNLSGSVATTTNNIEGRLNSIEGLTGSYATTGSNIFNGDQIISGSIDVQAHVSASSIHIDSNSDQLKIQNTVAGTEYNLSAGPQGFFNINVNGIPIALFGTSSIDFPNNLLVDGIISSSFVGNGAGLYNIPASGVTGLELDKIVNGNVSASLEDGTLKVNTDLFVDGILTAKELYVNYVTSSVLYESGSTKFGDTLDDIHEFTGSVNITGSIFLNGEPVGTGKLDSIEFYAFTSSYTTGAFTGSFIGDGSGLYNIPTTSITGSIDWSTIENTPTLVSGSSQIIYSGITGLPDVVLTSQTASMTVLSSSYALTASFALNAGGGTEGRTAQLVQSSASSTWTFAHNLGEQYPTVTIYDGDDNVVIPTIINAVDSNTLSITFSSPQTGYAVATVGGGLPFISSSFDGYVLAADGSAPIWKGGILSGSLQVTEFGFATTGSNTFVNDQVIQGSLTINDAQFKQYSVTGITTGTNTITNISSTTYDAAFFDYVVKDGVNMRAGTVTAVWDGTNISFNEVSTTDLGNTSPVVLSVILDSGLAQLRATISSGTWNFKTLTRGI